MANFNFVVLKLSEIALWRMNCDNLQLSQAHKHGVIAISISL